MNFDWYITTTVAVYGALVSSALGVLRLLEYRNTQTNIDISWVWRGDVELRHDILILNNSTLPVSVFGMDVVAAKRKRDKSIRHLVHFEDQQITFRIEPRGTHLVNFSQGEYFTTKNKHGPIFLRLWVVGNKKNPLWLPLT